ncbi:sugar ABC transporter substrate-binding protein [Vibrio sp. S9_S30]|uniref:ABC transporter substrate-binding protein n=1 Tax=Vibrio sp. S9_S30 TaxID=2720226 RepID=UPI0016815955|nr:sugar ABC transporter substrate-binding protein [Vibrio sp. S9_S30]MBD1557513.1 sugar ABC transporter substrate-binding protein [Vibrio sp. S9_S30]
MNTKIKLCAAIASVISVCLAPVASAEEVLRFATWDGGTSLDIQKAIAKKFEEQNPGTTIRVEAYAEGYDKKLIASFGGGNPPDVMYMWNFPKYQVSLQPLNELIKRDTKELNMEDIPQGLINSSTIGGQVYGMPVGFTTHIVWYNKDMFDAANVAYPTADWTWSDLREKSAKFRDKESKTYGFAVPAKPDLFDFEQFFWSNGATILSEDGTAIDGYVNSPQAIEMLDTFSQMVKKEEAVVYGVGDVTSGSSLFAGGKVAMFESAIWDKADFDEAKINYGVALLPKFGDKTSQSAVNAAAISIAKDSKNQDLAWRFVKYYMSPEAVKMRTNDLPVRNSVAQELGYTTNPVYQPFYEMLARSDKQLPAFLKHKNWDKISKNVAYAIEATMLGEGSAEENLNTAVKKSKRHL